MRRAIVVGSVAVALAAVGIWIGRMSGRDPAVLGTKVTRCKTVDGRIAVPQASQRLTAENAPLTVTVSGGRITSVLTPAVKIEPGAAAPTPRAAAFTIGAPKMSGGALRADVTIRNLTDCSVVVRAQALPRRGAWSLLAPVRFGTNDGVVVSPGRSVAGTFSVLLDGDGTYELTATAFTMFGSVR